MSGDRPAPLPDEHLHLAVLPNVRHLLLVAGVRRCGRYRCVAGHCVHLSTAIRDRPSGERREDCLSEGRRRVPHPCGSNRPEWSCVRRHPEWRHCAGNSTAGPLPCPQA